MVLGGSSSSNTTAGGSSIRRTSLLSKSESSRGVGGGRKDPRIQRQCWCELGDACHGMSAAWNVMKNKRGKFVRLPKSDVQLCASYCPYLRPKSGKLETDDEDPNYYYVAVHHFDPKVVETFAQDATQEDLLVSPSVNVELNEFLDIHMPSIVPSYNFNQGYSDLRMEMRRHLTNIQEAQQQKRAQRKMKRKEMLEKAARRMSASSSMRRRSRKSSQVVPLNDEQVSQSPVATKSEAKKKPPSSSLKIEMKPTFETAEEGEIELFLGEDQTEESPIEVVLDDENKQRVKGTEEVFTASRAVPEQSRSVPSAATTSRSPQVFSARRPSEEQATTVETRGLTGLKVPDVPISSQQEEPTPPSATSPPVVETVNSFGDSTNDNSATPPVVTSPPRQQNLMTGANPFDAANTPQTTTSNNTGGNSSSNNPFDSTPGTATTASSAANPFGDGASPSTAAAALGVLLETPPSPPVLVNHEEEIQYTSSLQQRIPPRVTEEEEEEPEFVIDPDPEYVAATTSMPVAAAASMPAVAAAAVPSTPRVRAAPPLMEAIPTPSSHATESDAPKKAFARALETAASMATPPRPKKKVVTPKEEKDVQEVGASTGEMARGLLAATPARTEATEDTLPQHIGDIVTPGKPDTTMTPSDAATGTPHIGDIVTPGRSPPAHLSPRALYAPKFHSEKEEEEDFRDLLLRSSHVVVQPSDQSSSAFESTDPVDEYNLLLEDVTSTLEEDPSLDSKPKIIFASSLGDEPGELEVEPSISDYNKPANIGIFYGCVIMLAMANIQYGQVLKTRQMMTTAPMPVVPPVPTSSGDVVPEPWSAPIEEESGPVPPPEVETGVSSEPKSSSWFWGSSPTPPSEEEPVESPVEEKEESAANKEESEAAFMKDETASALDETSQSEAPTEKAAATHGPAPKSLWFWRSKPAHPPAEDEEATSGEGPKDQALVDSSDADVVEPTTETEQETGDEVPAQTVEEPQKSSSWFWRRSPTSSPDGSMGTETSDLSNETTDGDDDSGESREDVDDDSFATAAVSESDLGDQTENADVSSTLEGGDVPGTPEEAGEGASKSSWFWKKSVQNGENATHTTEGGTGDVVDNSVPPTENDAEAKDVEADDSQTSLETAVFEEANAEQNIEGVEANMETEQPLVEEKKSSWFWSPAPSSSLGDTSRGEGELDESNVDITGSVIVEDAVTVTSESSPSNGGENEATTPASQERKEEIKAVSEVDDEAAGSKPSGPSTEDAKPSWFWSRPSSVEPDEKHGDDVHEADTTKASLSESDEMQTKEKEVGMEDSGEISSDGHVNEPIEATASVDSKTLLTEGMPDTAGGGVVENEVTLPEKSSDAAARDAPKSSWFWGKSSPAPSAPSDDPDASAGSMAVNSDVAGVVEDGAGDTAKAEETEQSRLEDIEAETVNEDELIKTGQGAELGVDLPTESSSASQPAVDESKPSWFWGKSPSGPSKEEGPSAAVDSDAERGHANDDVEVGDVGPSLDADLKGDTSASEESSQNATPGGDTDDTRASPPSSARELKGGAAGEEFDAQAESEEAGNAEGGAGSVPDEGSKSWKSWFWGASTSSSDTKVTDSGGVDLESEHSPGEVEERRDSADSTLSTAKASTEGDTGAANDSASMERTDAGTDADTDADENESAYVDAISFDAAAGDDEQSSDESSKLAVAGEASDLPLESRDVASENTQVVVDDVDGNAKTGQGESKPKTSWSFWPSGAPTDSESAEGDIDESSKPVGATLSDEAVSVVSPSVKTDTEESASTDDAADLEMEAGATDVEPLDTNNEASDMKDLDTLVPERNTLLGESETSASSPDVTDPSLASNKETQGGKQSSWLWRKLMGFSSEDDAKLAQEAGVPETHTQAMTEPSTQLSQAVDNSVDELESQTTMGSSETVMNGTLESSGSDATEQPGQEGNRTDEAGLTSETGHGSAETVDKSEAMVESEMSVVESGLAEELKPASDTSPDVAPPTKSWFRGLWGSSSSESKADDYTDEPAIPKESIEPSDGATKEDPIESNVESVIVDSHQEHEDYFDTLEHEGVDVAGAQADVEENDGLTSPASESLHGLRGITGEADASNKEDAPSVSSSDLEAPGETKGSLWQYFFGSSNDKAEVATPAEVVPPVEVIDDSVAAIPEQEVAPEQSHLLSSSSETSNMELGDSQEDTRDEAEKLRSDHGDAENFQDEGQLHNELNIENDIEDSGGGGDQGEATQSTGKENEAFVDILVPTGEQADGKEEDDGRAVQSREPQLIEKSTGSWSLRGSLSSLATSARSYIYSTDTEQDNAKDFLTRGSYDETEGASAEASKEEGLEEPLSDAGSGSAESVESDLSGKRKGASGTVADDTEYADSAPHSSIGQASPVSTVTPAVSLKEESLEGEVVSRTDDFEREEVGPEDAQPDDPVTLDTEIDEKATSEPVLEKPKQDTSTPADMPEDETPEDGKHAEAERESTEQAEATKAHPELRGQGSSQAGEEDVPAGDIVSDEVHTDQLQGESAEGINSKIRAFLVQAIVRWYNSGFALESVLLIGGAYFYWGRG